MGMYDYIHCKYPLPSKEAQGLLFQTKSMNNPFLDLYEIRVDGTLWKEEYDTRTEEADAAPLKFRMYRDNKRWKQLDYTGEIKIIGELEPHGKELRFVYFILRFHKGIVVCPAVELKSRDFNHK